MNYGRSVAPPSPRRSSGTCCPRDSEEPRHGKMSWRDETRPREKRPLPPKRCDHASRRRDAPDVTEYKIRKPHASSLRVLAPSPSLARALSLSFSLSSTSFPPSFPVFLFPFFLFSPLFFSSTSIPFHLYLSSPREARFGFSFSVPRDARTNVYIEFPATNCPDRVSITRYNEDMAAPTFVPNEAEIISRGKRVLRSSMEYGIRGIDRNRSIEDERKRR